jgi:outer membrane protein assembly factor BamB
MVRKACCGTLGAVPLLAASPAAAQLDPLLFLKTIDAHVLLVVDTSARMQYDADGNYYDPVDYSVADVGSVALGIGPSTAVAHYRRKYEQLRFSDDGSGDVAARITPVGDLESVRYANFYAKTRLAVARHAMVRAVAGSARSVRFGLIRTRQSLPTIPSPGNEGPVIVQAAGQQGAGDGPDGAWTLTRATVSVPNSTISETGAPLVASDNMASNATILSALADDPDPSGPRLIAAGLDARDRQDSLVETMLEDAAAEAARLVRDAPSCRSIVVVLIAGGGEAPGGHSPAAAVRASAFRSVEGQHVPIFVLGIAPTPAGAAELRAIADASGGRYFEIGGADIDSAYEAAVVTGASGVAAPAAVRAINTAVEAAFVRAGAAFPSGTGSPMSEFQTAGPIVGTVTLKNVAGYMDGTPLDDAEVVSRAGTAIPQPSNVLVTAGFVLPGFEGRLRALRTYRAVEDPAELSGWTFVADGRLLWEAHPPLAADRATIDSSSRNIFAVLPGHRLVPFTAASAGLLAPYLRLEGFDAAALIEKVRRAPIGAILDSTPALLTPPSRDPPPDPDYPAFAAALKRRRSLVFVGANDGMLHAFDARTGLEVWALVPFNMLPRLGALASGQPIDDFVFTVDGSPRLADIRLPGASRPWRSFLFFGDGPGGTFYQALDVTLEGLDACIPPDVDGASLLLACFADPGRLTVAWSFPDYGHFDPAGGRWGDVSAAATADERAVGQTWSAPLVGQIDSASGRYVAIVGSGFFPHSEEQSSSRGGATAGQRLFLLDAATGTVLDRRDAGNDGLAETVDECSRAPAGCVALKNALQADPVAAFSADPTVMNGAYIGDLDGNLWKVGLTTTGSAPAFDGVLTKAHSGGADQPLFASPALGANETGQYLFFATRGDLLPSSPASNPHVVGLRASGSMTPVFAIEIEGGGDQVSGQTVVAGDAVFFTTTRHPDGTTCAASDASAHALTFSGGPAYDTNGDGIADASDDRRVATLVNAGRATAPAVADRHLWFGAGARVSVLGDQESFDTDATPAGVRVIGWRQVR